MDDLDRLIDEAARQMAQREPPDALSRAVMDRVSSGARPLAWSRQLWGGLAAAVALTGILIFVGAPGQAPSVETPKVQGSVQGSGLRVQGSGLEAQGPGAELAVNPPTSRLAAVASRQEFSTDEMEHIDDPIVFESITPAPIEVQRLEVAASAVEPLEIVPIEIEPISTAND
jgi:hypothetical protein